VLHLVVILAAAAWAQSGPPVELRPVVEVRPRYVAYADGAGPTEHAAVLRARAGAWAHRGIASARVVVQDLRGWDLAGAMALGTSPSLAEGWARIDLVASDSLAFTVQAGRQPVTIGEGRLVSADDWSLGGRFLDALRVDVAGAPLTATYVHAQGFDGAAAVPLGLGVNVLRLGVGRAIPGTEWQVDAVTIVDGRQSARTPGEEPIVGTSGLHAKVDAGRFRGRVEGYGQGDLAGAGYMVGGRAGWVFGREEALVLSAAVDVESGGAHPWAPVLGETRRFRGLLGQSSYAGGVIDAAIVLEANVTPRFVVSGAVHERLPASGGTASATSPEAELSWYISPLARLGVGVAAEAYLPATNRWRALGTAEIDVRF
jgi:hypothetical protein